MKVLWNNLERIRVFMHSGFRVALFPSSSLLVLVSISHLHFMCDILAFSGERNNFFLLKSFPKTYLLISSLLFINCACGSLAI